MWQMVQHFRCKQATCKAKSFMLQENNPDAVRTVHTIVVSLQVAIKTNLLAELRASFDMCERENTARHDTARHSTAQHRTVGQGTAPYGAALRFAKLRSAKGHS